jgi:hypothetical protein
MHPGIGPAGDNQFHPTAGYLENGLFNHFLYALLLPFSTTGNWQLTTILHLPSAVARAVIL